MYTEAEKGNTAHTVNISNHIKKHGFTMIELLMVIMLVAILAGTALPQYLDFRTDGRKAAAVQYVNNIRSSLKMTLSKARMSCNRDTYPTVNAIINNTLLADGYCTSAQLVDPQDRKLLTNSVEVPMNPISNLNTIVSVACPTICDCVDVAAGYYYNQDTGDMGYPGLGDCE